MPSSSSLIRSNHPSHHLFVVLSEFPRQQNQTPDSDLKLRFSSFSFHLFIFLHFSKLRCFSALRESLTCSVEKEYYFFLIFDVGIFFKIMKTGLDGNHKCEDQADQTVWVKYSRQGVWVTFHFSKRFSKREVLNGKVLWIKSVRN